MNTAAAASTGVDYTSTARRRSFTDLPPPVRHILSAQLGAAVESVSPAGGGFTSGFAAVLSGRGKRLFAKAAPSTDTQIFSAYVREAEVHAALPPGLPIPRLRSALLTRVAGVHWQILCFDAVDGYMPGQPWTAADLGAIHSSLIAVQAGLTQLPAELAGPSMVDQFFGAGSPALVFTSLADAGTPPGYLGPLPAARLIELQNLAEQGVNALAGTCLLHNDLRADNIIMSAAPASTPATEAVFCDWNFLSTGPAWADWVALLVYPHHAGLGVSAWLEDSPLSAGADPEQIDAWLAVLASYMITSGAQPELVSSPRLRTHQRFTARILINWISERRKWDL